MYAYSVFSHLEPAVAEAWIREIGRVLRPGGLLLFTTLKLAHLDVWHRQAAEAVPHYAQCLRQAGFERAVWAERAAQGGALHLAIGGGDVRDASFYGETVLARAAVAAVATRTGFSLAQFDETDDLPQSFVLLRRPSPGVAEA